MSEYEPAVLKRLFIIVLLMGSCIPLIGHTQAASDSDAAGMNSDKQAQGSRGAQQVGDERSLGVFPDYNVGLSSRCSSITSPVHTSRTKAEWTPGASGIGISWQVSDEIRNLNTRLSQPNRRRPECSIPGNSRPREPVIIGKR